MHARMYECAYKKTRIYMYIYINWYITYVQICSRMEVSMQFKTRSMHARIYNCASAKPKVYIYIYIYIYILKFVHGVRI